VDQSHNRTLNGFARGMVIPWKKIDFDQKEEMYSQNFLKNVILEVTICLNSAQTEQYHKNIKKFIILDLTM
jgi:hypothetical protein